MQCLRRGSSSPGENDSLTGFRVKFEVCRAPAPCYASSWKRAAIIRWGTLASVAAFAAASLPDSMDERVRACTACHGKEGRATTDGYYPRIAGKPAGYLYNQLANFRDGRRRNPMMTYIVSNLPDAYLREIAGHFASQHPPYPP